MLTRKEKVEGLFRPLTPWKPEALQNSDIRAKEWFNFNIGYKVESLLVSEINGLVKMSFMLVDIWNDHQMRDIISNIEELLEENGYNIKSITPVRKSKLTYELIILV